MSYQVIARKYRPQRFADVVGQEHVTRTLSQAIEKERIAHAYIFCGPRGTGKTTVARIFAKCLNCTGGPKVDFDDSDPRCQEIAQGRSLDVLEIDGASNNGVEQVRDLRETCRYAPASSKFKIYIIDEVHMLSAAAFNALLKTLEEPPAHVKFMFATTDPEKVLPTILSRCQRFDLRRIPAALIAKHLTHIAGKEGVQVEPAALDAIARGAEGGMRDAESALDQLISFCGKEIAEADVLSMFGLAAQAQLLGLTRAILEGQVQIALKELNDLAGHGKDLGRLMSDLLSHVRNLLIFQVSKGDLSMLEVSEAEAATLKSQAALVKPEIMTRILDVLAETERKMRNAASRKIVMEVGILKAIEARNSVSLDVVLKQLQSLRQADAPRHANPTAPAAPATGPAVMHDRPSTAQPGTQQAPSATMPDMDAAWAALLSGANPLVRASLENARPVSFANRTLTIGFPAENEGQMTLVDTPKNLAQFHEILKAAGWDAISLKFVKGPPTAPGTGNAAKTTTKPDLSPPQPAPGTAKPTAPPTNTPETPAAQVPFDKNTFKNDPEIQKALDIFKGQLVDIRTT